jgi:hypothetical protein
VSRYAVIASWPIREVLLAYVALLKRDAAEAYARQVDRYYHGRLMKDEPKPPAILGSAVKA